MVRRHIRIVETGVRFSLGPLRMSNGASCRPACRQAETGIPRLQKLSLQRLRAGISPKSTKIRSVATIVYVVLTGSPLRYEMPQFFCGATLSKSSLKNQHAHPAREGQEGVAGGTPLLLRSRNLEVVETLLWCYSHL